jgi:hypothetical protein
MNKDPHCSDGRNFMAQRITFLASATIFVLLLLFSSRPAAAQQAGQ